MRVAPSRRPKKRLGQHFLRDPNIARKIVAAIDPQPRDILLEIGPGEGALTQYLVPRVQKLIAVDIDPQVVSWLHGTYRDGSAHILHDDFLSLDLTALAGLHGGSLRIVGNIPYNITTPILFHILDHRRSVEDATLMMQREVARRIVAKPCTKAYGILSVSVGLCAETGLLFDVGPRAFHPIPRVTSSVVRLRLRAALPYGVSDEQFFRYVVRTAFGRRRKTLRNSLLPLAQDAGIVLPESLGLRRRPEELTVGEFAALANTLRDLLPAGRPD